MFIRNTSLPILISESSIYRNDMPGARQWLQKAIDINPGTEAARRAGQLLTA